MLPFAYYLLKVIICSGVLFGYYWFFLRNKIFHSYNRFYLLAIVILSITFPLVKVNVWHKSSESQPAVIKMLQVVNSSDEYMDEVVIYSQRNHISKETIFLSIYLIICAVFLFVLIRSLYRIRHLLKTNPSTFVDNICFIKTDAAGTPFSFLKFIFWNEAIDLQTKAGKQIFKHEVAHIQEKHSYDKLFMNSLLIFFWANPFFWFIRKELNMIHEFVADRKAIEDGDTSDFAAMILHATYPQQQFMLANNFFYSPIKRRLLMLTKQNMKASYFSRLLVLPVALVVFAAFTLKTKTYIESKASIANKIYTVMIDAGHGGMDKGATNATATEKDLCLILAKKIQALNKSANIKIMLTRETDIYQTPMEKAKIAKEAGADLFISIHIDGAPTNSKNMRTGMDVYVSRDEYGNSEASKLLASAVIGSFQKNYGLPVNMNPQQREVGIWVLQENTCPSVLIEAGCINNDNDLNYLKTDKAVETFAVNMLDAISNYLYQKETVSGNIEKRNDTTVLKKSKAKEIENDIYADASQVVNINGNTKLAIEGINYKYFSAANEPLYIVNGTQSTKAMVAKINPEDIDNIRVLKAVTAFETYAEKAKNGVIIINTKPENILSNKLIIIDNKVYETNTAKAIMMASSTSNFDSITVLDKEDAIKKYGKRGSNGAVVMTTKTKEENMSKQEPTVTLSGMKGPKIHISQLQHIKTLEVTGDDYKITAATVYFSGTGFPDVIQANLLGKSLDQLQQYFIKVVPGSVVVFDNIYALKADGTKIEIKGKAFGFYDKEDDITMTVNDKIFTKVEVEPSFPGGAEAWKQFLQKNLNANTPVDEGWKAGVYKIIVEFIVDTDGNVSDVKTSDYTGSKTANQCINLIKNGPKWLPAMQNDKKVKAYRKQPITFVVSEA